MIFFVFFCFASFLHLSNRPIFFRPSDRPKIFRPSDRPKFFRPSKNFPSVRPSENFPSVRRTSVHRPSGGRKNFGRPDGNFSAGRTGGKVSDGLFLDGRTDRKKSAGRRDEGSLKKKKIYIRTTTSVQWPSDSYQVQYSPTIRNEKRKQDPHISYFLMIQFQNFSKTSNDRPPLENRSDRRQTLPKRVSDDPQHLIFRRQNIKTIRFFRKF